MSIKVSGCEPVGLGVASSSSVGTMVSTYAPSVKLQLEVHEMCRCQLLAGKERAVCVANDCVAKAVYVTSNTFRQFLYFSHNTAPYKTAKHASITRILRPHALAEL